MPPKNPKTYASAAEKNMQDRFRADFPKQPKPAPVEQEAPAAEETLYKDLIEDSQL